ncbi:MAG: hypothetical protein ABR581_05815 [Thermoleophilaceae bacterium]
MHVNRHPSGSALPQAGRRLKWALWGIAALLPALLFAAHPLLTLFEENETELPLAVIWQPLGITLAVTVALYGVLVLVTRSWTKAGALTALVVVWFFYWDTFKHDLSGLHLSGGLTLALWLVLCATAAVAIALARRGLGTVMLGAGVAAVVLTLSPALKVASYQHRHPAVRASDPRLWATDPLPAPRTAVKRPDIYVIVPDDYARADVLRRYFHYDNSAFEAQLRRRGFTISEDARSPYSDSESNIAAELNMGYLEGLGRVLGKKSQDVRPLKTLMESSRASRLAKSLGYRHVHLDSDEVTFAAGNPDISSVATPDSFPSLWLRKSVLREIGGRFGFDDGAQDERFRRNYRSSFSRLDSVPGQRSPKLVVFHTLLPHDPYIFGARGQAVTFPSTSDEVIHSRLGMRYYLPQLRYLEGKLLHTVDTIRRHSKDAVIVLQADEGFESGDKTFDEPTVLDIRVKGLLAFSLPGVSGVRPPRPPNTVNTLRYVFNKLFGTHYRMLPSTSAPDGDYPYQWERLRVR